MILCTHDFPVCLISLSRLPKSNKRFVSCLNFGTQNLRPSNDTVIFQRPSCGANIAVASGFIAGTAPVVVAKHDNHSCETDNGLCVQSCTTLQSGGYVCHCRDGFTISPTDYKSCVGQSYDTTFLCVINQIRSFVR